MTFKEFVERYKNLTQEQIEDLYIYLLMYRLRNWKEGLKAEMKEVKI